MLDRRSRRLEIPLRIARIGILSLAIATAAAADPSVLTVRSTGELYTALSSATRGQQIHLTAGTYDLDRPLQIPDGVALAADGEMRVDANGTALEWAAGPVATLRFAATLDGDHLTLGDAASLSGLRIEALPRPPAEDPDPAGNIVAVVSRRPQDLVSVAIRNCEIVNPNAFGIGATGPARRSILVMTRHRAEPALPATHVGSHLSLAIERSIVRAPESDVIHANNLAARGRIDLSLAGNRFEGQFSAVGATTHLDEVSDAITNIESRDNVFVHVAGYDEQGWTLIGGTSAPHAKSRIPGVYRNTLRLRSVNDRIEGFRIGIWAAAGRRIADFSDPVAHNRLELELANTVIHTRDAGGADLSLHGAVAFALSGDARELGIGNDNRLQADLHGVHGSGLRANVFSNVTGPVLPSVRGTGNRVVLLGSEAEFARSNPGIEPLPPCGCWTPRPGERQAWPGEP